nr:MAG TPA: hypothetical protein [Bacteriophage sp.]
MINDPRKIHETIVRDVYDIINDTKDFDNIEWMRTKNNTGSIARRAANLTLVFPVLVSTALSIDKAIIISKALERKCATLMQILFSSIQVTSAKDLGEYISQFHSNLNTKNLDLGDFINAVDTLANEGAITITDRDVYDTVMEDMKNINYYIDTALTETSVNDFKVKKNMYGEQSVVLEKKISINPNNVSLGTAAVVSDNPLPSPSQTRTAGSANFTTGGSRTRTLNTIKNNIINNDIRTKETITNKTVVDANNSGKDAATIFKTQLTQAELNKANELVPTTMFVNFISKSKDGDAITVNNGVVGIKCKMYPINSMDIIYRISSKYDDNNWLINLIKASTREISFLKDFLFAIDKAKLDAINMSKETNSAKMFRTLERRSSKNVLYTLLKKNNAAPITSLVISQEEIEYLKKYNNLDLEKVYNARVILEKFNLMDIVIVDEVLETAKFLFDDGDGVFETLTLDALEKEAKDSSYKKVVNLMGKLTH